MPSTLKIALGFMAFGVLLAVLGERWLSVAVNAALMFGVWRGNESVRKLLIMVSWLGLVLNGIGAVLAFIAMAAWSGLAGIVFYAAAWGFMQCGYMIWCLGRPDVQHWMFNRSLKLV